MAGEFQLQNDPGFNLEQGTQSNQDPYDIRGYLQKQQPQQQITPEQLFGALAHYVQKIHGAHYDSGGFQMEPSRLDQMKQDQAAWDMQNQASLPETRIAHEHAMNPHDSRPTFTEQEQANRAMDPQQRLNQAMGPAWASATPEQRRAMLQQLAGQQPHPMSSGPNGVQVAEQQGSGPSMYQMFQ